MPDGRGGLETRGIGTPIEIVYDGDCPFCAAYMRMVRLKDTIGPVSLIDARQHPHVVRQLRAEGIDIDDTMVVNFGGRRYAGPQAVELLSLLSSKVGVMNRLSALLLRDGRRAAFFYPILRTGRRMALILLGRKRIGGSDA